MDRKVVDIKSFFKEGMAQYGVLSEMAEYFEGQIHSLLRKILLKKRGWGKFKPKVSEMPNLKSVRYWKQYPVIHLWLPGKIDNASPCIVIGINWYQAKENAPFYFVRIGDYSAKLDGYDKKIGKLCDDGVYEYYEHGIKYQPSTKHLDIEGDFEKLIAKFVKALA